MFYNHTKNYLRGSLTGLLSLLLVGLMLSSCGDDEPKTIDNPPAEEEPVFPSDSEEDDNNAEEEQTPDETEEPNYYIPESSEFYGVWECYWKKRETYSYLNGRWVKTNTLIYDESYLNGELWRWPNQIAFFQDAYESNTMTWGSPAAKLDEITEAIANKGNWSYDGLHINNGFIISGDKFRWVWYEQKEMMVLLNGKNEVCHRWKISKFDGNNFTISPPFNDFPNPAECSMFFRDTLIYRRCNSDK